MPKFDCNGGVLHLFLFKGVILLTNIIVWLTKGGKIGLIVGYARFTHFFAGLTKVLNSHSLLSMHRLVPFSCVLLRAHAFTWHFHFLGLKDVVYGPIPPLFFCRKGQDFKHVPSIMSALPIFVGFCRADLTGQTYLFSTILNTKLLKSLIDSWYLSVKISLWFASSTY